MKNKLYVSIGAGIALAIVQAISALLNQEPPPKPQPSSMEISYPVSIEATGYPGAENGYRAPEPPTPPTLEPTAYVRITPTSAPTFTAEP